LTKYRVYLDMDNVLVDFDKGAVEAHRLDYDEFLRERTDGVWDIRGTLARLQGLPEPELSMEDFWKPICDIGFKFWQDLEKMPWTDQLLSMMDSWDLENKTFIVTDPSTIHCDFAVEGKVRCCKRTLLRCPSRLVPIARKSLLAKPDTVLIDDKEENVADFIAEGGQAILFPHKGNILYREADYPLYHVVSELKKLEQM